MALSLDMKVAVVGAAAALGGTLAGGAVTWWQTRDLQQRQFAREDAERLRNAAAAASVELQRFDTARDAVAAMLRSGYYADVTARLRERLSISDLELVALELRAGERSAEDTADLCVQQLAARVRGEGTGTRRIASVDRPQLRLYGACAAKGAAALGRLSAEATTG